MSRLRRDRRKLGARAPMTPEEDIDGELNVEHNWSDGRGRLTMFRERTNDAIISQTNHATNPVTGTQVPTITIGNVDAIRVEGIKASAEENNVLVERLQLFGSATSVDSRIVSDPTWAGINSLTGKRHRCRQPRAVCAGLARQVRVTYQPTDAWAWTTAARYSSKQYSTLSTPTSPRMSTARSTSTSF
jgi:iron complex outermembrane recepter protein